MGAQRIVEGLRVDLGDAHEQVLHLACGSDRTPVPFDKTSSRTADGFSDRIVLGESPAGEAPLPIRDDAQLTAELLKRFPQHKANILRYMSLAESIQMRFGILTAASILPMKWRLRLLASWPLGLWRKWAGLTASEGLRELFPGCLLYTSPSPRDATLSRMPSSA